MRDVQSFGWKRPRDASEPIIYIVRHGETDLNAGNKFRGFMDVELDKNGVLQAYDAHDTIGKVHFNHAYSSDLQRATKTLEIVLRGQEVVAQRLASMRPWNIGFFTGEQKSEKKKLALQNYANHPSEPIPDGESLNWFRSRYQHFFWDCIKEAAESGPTLLAQHASNNHEVGNVLYGDIDTLDVDPGGVIAIYHVLPAHLEARILKGQSHSKQQSYS